MTCPYRQILKWKGSSSQGSSPNQGPHGGLSYESTCWIKFDNWVDIVVKCENFEEGVEEMSLKY